MLFKQTKQINALMLIFVILCSFSLNLKISTRKSMSQSMTLGVDVATANQCFSALMDSMPPQFCWKKGADVGVIPTGCPDGFFRSLALCYAYCKPGWTHILGICYQDCKSGYTNHGLSCYKNIFRWYFKSSYIPESITNFSDRIPCPGDMYRGGALCYRNCATIGMFNCGIGACVSEESQCGPAILQMTLGVLDGLATGISTVVSLGATAAARTAAKTGLKAAVKGLAKGVAKAASSAVKKALTGKFKATILNKAKQKIKDYVKDTVKDAIQGKAQEAIVGAVCNGVWDATIKKSLNAPSIEDIGDKVLNTLDIFDARNMATSCSNITDGGLECAKSVVDGLSTFDPSGLLTIASAFMHPSCDVPVSKPKELEFVEFADFAANTYQAPTTEEKAGLTMQDVISKVPANCIWVFLEKNFAGKKMEICKSMNYVGDEFNEKIVSFAVGQDVNGYFFEHARWRGDFLRFSRRTAVDDVAKFTYGDIKLDKLISGVYVGNDSAIAIKSPKLDFQTVYWLNNETQFTFTPSFSPMNNDNINSLNILLGNKNVVCAFTDGKNQVEKEFTSNQVLFAADSPKPNLVKCYAK